jgi:hypothetical protein
MSSKGLASNTEESRGSPARITRVGVSSPAARTSVAQSTMAAAVIAAAVR